MTADRTFMSADLSRRAVLHLAVAGGGALMAATVPAAAVAASKIGQKAVKYQPGPKGNARCDKCRQWQAPAACKLVDGVISPSGWCSLFAPK